MSSPRKAVAYMRCSTDMQEDSPDQQEKAIREYAQGHGFEVVDKFVDFGESGTTFDQRPGFMALKNTVDRSPGFAAVIAYDESRWGRAIDAEENTFWRVYFRKRGVDVLLVKSSIDPQHEFAPMLKAFEGVQASQYSKKLSELTLRGAKDNGAYSNGGSAPFGYRRVAVNQKTGADRVLAEGEWCVKGQEKVKWALGEEREQDIVRRIFADRLEKKPYVTIAANLNRLGIPCPKRGRWRNLDQKWSGVTVKAILENPAYYGARVYNKNSMSRILARARGMDMRDASRYPHWRNGTENWVIEESAHPAIISKRDWEAVQSTVRPNLGVRHGNRGIQSDYLLTGLIRCAQCGFAYQGQTTRSKGRPYPRYVDGGWTNKRVCRNHMIPKLNIERAVVQAVKEVLLDPEVIGRIEEVLRAAIGEVPRRRQQEQKIVREKLDDVKSRRQNIIAAIEQARVGAAMEVLLRRLEEVTQEVEAAEREVEETRKWQALQADIRTTADHISRFIEKFDEVFQAAPPDEKKLLLRKCVSEVVVDRERGVLQVAVRRIPAVTAELEELFMQKRRPTTGVVGQSKFGVNANPQKNRPTTQVVGLSSSGDRT